MKRLLLFLGLVLAAGQARAAAPFDIAHATTIGGSDAITLLRFTTISPVLLALQSRSLLQV